MTIPKGATHELEKEFGGRSIFFKLLDGELYRFSDFYGWIDFDPFVSIAHLLSNPRMRNLNPTIEVFVYEDST